MAAKFLHFYNAADDALTLPASALVSMDQTTDTNIRLAFSDDGGTSNTVDLTIVAGSEKQVMKGISEAIAFSKDQFVVVADDVNSIYIDSNISNVAAVATANLGGVEHITVSDDYDFSSNVFARNATILVNIAMVDGKFIRLPEATTSNGGLSIKVLFGIAPADNCHVGFVTTNIIGGVIATGDADQGAIGTGTTATQISAVGTANKRVTFDVDGSAADGSGMPGSQITFHYTGVANQVICEGTVIGDVNSITAANFFNTTAVNA